MASNGASGSIREGEMIKKSQGVSRFGKNNWKTRYFVLVPDVLTYWEGFGGPQNKDAKKKGTIEMNTVTVCEPVPEDAFKPARQHLLQIKHAAATLYTQAKSAEDRQQWLDAIRDIIKHNRGIVPNFHAGAFVDKKWTCCDGGDKAMGCETAFDYASIGGQATTLRTVSMSTRSLDDPLPQPPDGGNAASGRTASTSSNLSNSSGGFQPNLPSTPEPPAQVPVFQPENPNQFEVVAMYPYQGLDATDLSMVAQDRLLILEQPEEHWWKARSQSGKEGMIPSNYVRKIGMESEPWFHGKISRAQASNMLKLANTEGCFLVRESESKKGQYSLSVSHGSALRHYHIQNEGDQIWVNDRHKFTSIPKLIEYHKLNSGGLVTRLRKTISDVKAPITAGLGHDKWEIDPAEIQLGKELGAGQFGVVLAGTYRGNIPVAVKMMKDGAMSEDDFISEAQVMKNFVHENLVQLYGVCTTVRPIYIVQELVANGCLLDYLRNNEWLKNHPDKLHIMAEQSASAMMFLETKGFIHRDLAARNCLIGDNFLIKVADFGLARFVMDDEYTASEGTKFPIKWAAPEVISYARFSTKSDVWSYGILLWEIFSLGIMPYASLTNAEVVDKVIQGHRMGCPKYAQPLHYDLMTECWNAEHEARPTFAALSVRLRDGSEYQED